MSLEPYPDASSAKTVNDDNPDVARDNEIAYITINKNLELRVKSDDALRASIEALIEEIREVKELLMGIAGG